MKRLRICLAASLVLAGVALTSILHSETRRLTAEESAAIGACAARYYLCTGQCQNSPSAEARASCEADCLRTYNACVNGSIRPLPPTAPSPSPLARPTATALPRNIPPQRVSGAPTSGTTTKPVATIAPRGVVPQQMMPGQTPAPAQRNVSSQRAGNLSRTVTPTPQPTIVSQTVARRLASQLPGAAPTPTPTPPPPNFSRRPIGSVHRTQPAATIPPQSVPPGPAPTTSGVATAKPGATIAPQRSRSHRRSHRRHRSQEEEASPTPTPPSQPTPAT